MFMFKHVIALTIATAVPTVGLVPPIAAQQEFQLNTVRLQPGAAIPASVQNTSGTQYYYSDTAYDVTLTVDQPVYNSLGQVVIPVGSRIIGTMQPVAEGSKFVAYRLVIGNQDFPLQASSDILHDQKDPRQYSSEAITEDSAIGAAAGAILGAVTGGGVTAGQVVGGAAAGAGLGNVTAPRVVVLQPETIVDVTLRSPLVL